MKPDFELIQKEDFNADHGAILAELLGEQGKVRGNLKSKINRCKLICIARVENKIAGIGAIKERTPSVFCPQKAHLMDLAGNFEWELGYIYTCKRFERQGIATNIVKLLLEQTKDDNLIASTEIEANPAMVRILEKNKFRRVGETWESDVHKEKLGLFLKFKDD